MFYLLHANHKLDKFNINIIFKSVLKIYCKQKIVEMKAETIKIRLYCLHLCTFQPKDNDDHNLLHKYHIHSNDKFLILFLVYRVSMILNYILLILSFLVTSVNVKLTPGFFRKTLRKLISNIKPLIMDAKLYHIPDLR